MPSSERGAEPSGRSDANRNARDKAYWHTTARLVQDYFELCGGFAYDDSMHPFGRWLEHTPDALRIYSEGEDMDRAALVERYLQIRVLRRQ